jgi:transmembrane sensor
VFSRSADAVLEPVASTPEQVTLRLDAGSARFSVVPNARRRFQILAGAVTVQVIGTVFTVTAPAGERELGAGESGRFDQAPPPEKVEPAPAPAPVVEVLPPPRVVPAWRALAQDGDYAAAFAELEREGSKSVRDVAEDLLLAADASRLGGRPDKAVPYLERLVRRYPRDARAPLAAFTLGRTLLEQLGRPREAAQAFATARRLGGPGGLAEDALAREVESWSRAGDTALARERATEFLKRYPAGRRAAAVRRLGGIE